MSPLNVTRPRVSSPAAAVLALVGLLTVLPSAGAAEPKPVACDVLVYGGTSGGVAAAVQARRLGLDAVLVEPGQHLGGLSSGGLGWTDIGNKAAIGGLSREFYGRVRAHYADAASWVHETPEKYPHWQRAFDADAMWYFEPHVAEQIFEAMVKESGVTVVKGRRLDREAGVTKDGTRITSVTMTDGTTYTAPYFIDATYEGDLLAAAGVSSMTGREACDLFGETLNGVQVAQAKKHQLMRGISPFVIKGDPSSGLLPGIDPTGPGTERGGDHRFQAYNFRMCLTNVPANRVAIEKPANYDEKVYELLFRNFEQGETNAPWKPDRLPNGKTDVNNNFGFSTDFLGQNYNWAEADDAERQAIFAAHRDYQLGLMWTLQNHPRVPEAIRKQIGPWGLCKDEFTDHGGWPHQIYVREARRLTGEYVMTQANCQGRVVAEDPVGLAAYTMDSHNTQRYITPEGDVQNEGDVQVGGFPPYPISYRSLTPKRAEATNLLVPVCVSSTHIAFGSIRMEPVFMVLGQSAATAIALAKEKNAAVQDVPYEALKEKLLADKQILAWTGGGERAYGVDPATLTGIVADDATAKLTGDWTPSSVTPGYLGTAYLHDDNMDKGTKSATFSLTVPTTGRYEVRLVASENGNRASNVPVTITAGSVTKAVTVDQRKAPIKEAATSAGKPVELPLHSLGQYDLTGGEVVTVTIGTKGTNGHVIVDGVQLLESRRP